MKRTTASYRLKKIKCHISDGRLLDIGCADGVFIQQARHAGIEAEGIDISQVAVEKALQLGVPAYCRDIFDHNPEYKYETITGFDVLEHVLDPIKFLDSLKRLLKLGGVLVLTTPNRLSLFRMLMGKRWYFYIPEEHLYYFDPITVRQFLEHRGFDLVNCKRISKPLTIKYGLTQFAEYNPMIYKILNAFSLILPGKFLNTPMPFYIGEMMVVARNNGNLPNLNS